MKIKIRFDIGFVNATREITMDLDDEGFVGLTEDEREEEINKTAWDTATDYLDVSWEIVE